MMMLPRTCSLYVHVGITQVLIRNVNNIGTYTKHPKPYTSHQERGWNDTKAWNVSTALRPAFSGSRAPFSYSMNNETHPDKRVGYKCKKTVEIVAEYLRSTRTNCTDMWHIFAQLYQGQFLWVYSIVMSFHIKIGWFSHSIAILFLIVFIRGLSKNCVIVVKQKKRPFQKRLWRLGQPLAIHYTHRPFHPEFCMLASVCWQ